MNKNPPPMKEQPHPFSADFKPVCPPALITKARQNPPMRTAIIRAGFPLPMKAAHEATTQRIIEPVFVGEPELIKTEAQNLNWDISNFDIVDGKGESECARLGAKLGREKQVAAIMKGHLHTDKFMKALINSETGVRTDKRLFHLFFISDPRSGRGLIVSDAAVNVAPDIETRKHILTEIDRVARALDIKRPKIAILSATETPISAMPSSIEAFELKQWADKHLPTSDVSGPLAFDLIISKRAARIKGMADDKVAGNADAVLVPGIVSGNLLFKSLVYLSGGCAGGIVLGGRVPILLTSRADPAAARLASCALASIMSNVD